MRYIIVSRKGDAVLSRLASLPGEAPREVFWLPAAEAEATNYRHAVLYPSADACHKGAATYDGDAREVPDEVTA